MTDAAFGMVGNKLKQKAKELGDEGLWTGNTGFQSGSANRFDTWEEAYEQLRKEQAGKVKYRQYTVHEQQADGSWKWVRESASSDANSVVHAKISLSPYGETRNCRMVAIDCRRKACSKRKRFRGTTTLLAPLTGHFISTRSSQVERKDNSWLIAAGQLLVPVALRVLLVAGLTVGTARGLLPAAAADVCLAALGLSAL